MDTIFHSHVHSFGGGDDVYCYVDGGGNRYCNVHADPNAKRRTDRLTFAGIPVHIDPNAPPGTITLKSDPR